MFTYYNLRERTVSADIDTLFPGWQAGDERLVVVAPHDDDALLGAGYAIRAAQRQGGEVHVVIVCNGQAGYSDPSQKDTIVGIRRKETQAAHERFGIPSTNIHRLDLPDFSAVSRLGMLLPDGSPGALSAFLPLLRKIRITRLMMPNGYREHTDHTAAYDMSRFDAIQAGDAVVSDWGELSVLRSALEYAVWGDFSPEDALVHGAPSDIRANRALVADTNVEDAVMDALRAFESQQTLIGGLVTERAARRFKDGYMELYIEFSVRPPLPYEPYKQWMAGIKGE